MCGEERWEEVPIDFAKEIRHLLQRFSKSPDRLNPAIEMTTQSTSLRGTDTGQAPSSSSGSGSQSVGGPSQSTPTSNGPENIEYPPRFGTVIDTNAWSTTVLYVLFGVARGDDLEISQIKIQNHDDQQFFKQLKEKYCELRGFWRRWFGIWRYSHCEFRKVGLISLISHGYNHLMTTV